MNKRGVLKVAAALLLLVPAGLFASGFGYYEHGAKATGMAGAFVAQANDVSAIFYNPAGIAFLEGTNIMVAMHPVRPSNSATLGSISTDGITPWLPPASAFAATNLTSNIKVGLGFFVPYGLEAKWPKNWIGSALSSRAYLSSYFIRPTIAVKLSDQFSVGFGIDYVISKIALEQQQPFAISPLLPSGRVGAEVEGTGSGWGFSFGALWKASDKLQVGVRYQREVEIEYEGDGLFAYTASGHPLVDALAAGVFMDQDITTQITMPSEFVIGAAFMPSDKLTLEFDAQLTGWSSYETLKVNFEHGKISTEDVGNWEDSWMYRFGGQYQFAEEWFVRAGFIRDTNPIPVENLKPILPDADRNEVTFGLGYDTLESCCWGNFTADFAIQYIMFEERTSKFAQFPATYDSNALILGLSVGFNF